MFFFSEFNAMLGWDIRAIESDICLNQLSVDSVIC